MLDALDHLNAGRGFLGGELRKVLICSPGLIGFFAGLSCKTRFGPVVCAGPWRCVVDGCVIGEFAGDDEDGL